MSWLDALGWFGSALLVLSLLQARILRLDVTAGYRDVTPGEFVWRHSGPLTGHDWSTIRTPDAMVGAYDERLDFRRDGEAWALAVAGATRP